jgi:ABC-type nitrate/sulfonate/bicarbonate transport system substrate-binding protein
MGAIVELAKERGFFKAAGLDVRPSILNGGAIVATAVTGGSFDFGAVNAAHSRRLD